MLRSAQLAAESYVSIRSSFTGLRPTDETYGDYTAFGPSSYSAYELTILSVF